jgi:hypothetical protein
MVRVWIGTMSRRGDAAGDQLRLVEFEGEQLGSCFTAKGYRHGRREKVYRLPNGDLVVFVEEWSSAPGEANRSYLLKAQLRDFQPGARFERLGQVAGLARPLSLDEALEQASRLSSGRDS